MSSSTSHQGRLFDKVAIITGSSSGLGRAIALAFAAEGARLVVCADLQPSPRGDFGDTEAGKPTHEIINQRYGDSKSLFVRTDVTVSGEIEELVKKTVEAGGGRLDIMVNNAGVGGAETAGKIHEMKEEVWDFTMNLNSRSVFLGCKYACTQFLKQEPHSTGHRGWIINTASILGLVGLKTGAAAYCASKGAVVLLTKQVALEYASSKIHCNALCPGSLVYIASQSSLRRLAFCIHFNRLTAPSLLVLKTPMTHAIYEDVPTRDAITAATPWGDWGKVEDVARCAVFLASEDAAYVTGVALPIDGGYTAR